MSPSQRGLNNASLRFKMKDEWLCSLCPGSQSQREASPEIARFQPIKGLEDLKGGDFSSKRKEQGQVRSLVFRFGKKFSSVVSNKWELCLYLFGSVSTATRSSMEKKLAWIAVGFIGPSSD
ncbi:unnamed protein product [Natator depressus]